MATYKLWLRIKDSLGNEKEIDAGNVNIDLSMLTETELAKVCKQLDPYFTTEAEVEKVVTNKDTIKYSDFKLREEEPKEE